MRLIYVAHKIRDPRGPYWMVQHIREAEQVSIRLWEMGAAVVCPGLNTYLMDGALPDSIWLNGDIEILSRCDAVVMSPNSVDSKGAQAEKTYAEIHNIPVFHWPADKDRIAKFIKPV